MSGRRKRTAGVTLMEVLIAVTLLSLLMVGMAMAMRIGLNAYSKTDAVLMDDRRVAGAQRVLEQEVEGMIPLVLPCMGGENMGGAKFAMFQGEAQVMRLVSTFSLQQAWRGQPLLLELFVIPGEDGRGVRLVVNEIPYHPLVVGRMCLGFGQDAAGGPGGARFAAPVTSEHTFVLADKLEYCRFSYQQIPKADQTLPPVWLPTVAFQGWPQAVRIEMQPLEPDPSRLQPLTVTAPIRVHRSPEIQYGDY